MVDRLLALSTTVPPMTKIGFTGDSIMSNLQLNTSNSPLLHSLMDVPRDIVWDPNDPGALAHSGSDSGTGTAGGGGLTNATVIAQHQAYAADIEFGLVGGNESGGSTLTTTINNIKTYMAAMWSVKPSMRFVWHVPTPQVGRAFTNLINQRNQLFALERADPRVRIMDLSRFMLDTNATGNAPIGGQANAYGNVVDAAVGQHPTGFLAAMARGAYTTLLDEMRVRRSQFPLTSISDVYDATNFPGGNIMGLGRGPMGTMTGSQSPFGSPAKYTGTLASNYDPVTPGEITVNGVTGTSINFAGRSVRAQSLDLNTGNISPTTTANYMGWQRGGMTWASSATKARLYVLASLEAAVGVSAFYVQLSGNVGGTFTQYNIGVPPEDTKNQCWNGSAALTRVLQIAPGIEFNFDAGSTWSMSIVAVTPTGTIPSGRISLGNILMQPVFAN